MVRLRPDLARLPRMVLAAIAAGAGLLPACAGAAETSLHIAPMQSLSSSGQERVLDWRGWSARSSFAIPAGAEAQNLRIVLDATPAESAPAPHAWIEVRLNGSEPAILRPEPYPFSAQVDFPAQYLRPGRNEAEIRFVSPAGACPASSDGGWALDLAASRLELTAPPYLPQSAGELDALLRSELLAPRRIAIVADGIGQDAEAGFQAWSALALGVRMAQTPRFVENPANADLVVRYVEDAEAGSGWLSFGQEAGAALVAVRAPDPDSAIAALRDYAASGVREPFFTLPAFDASWSPEPRESVFYLSERPGRLAMRIGVARTAAVEEVRLGVTLNGHAVSQLAFGARAADIIFLPPGLLRPGLNRVRFTPEATPAAAADPCLEDAASPARLSTLRLHPGQPVGPQGLFGFAAGAFPAQAHLALPAASFVDRAAQLRFLVQLARQAGRLPDIASVGVSLSAAAGSTIVIAPRTLIPADLLALAPVSMHAVLRGERPERLSLGSRALADGVSVPVVMGGAAVFETPAEPANLILLLTEAAGADFAPTLDHLVDSGMLAGFDGRVVRWTRDGLDVQDRGPWRAAPLRLLPPVARSELERTGLFLAIVAGLSLSWVLARGRTRRRRRFT